MLNQFLLCLQIKTYAVMEYHDQPIQFINKFYIRAQGLGSENYDIIAIIWTMLMYLPTTFFCILALITPAYVYPKIRSLIEYLNLNNKKRPESMYKLLGYGKVLKKACNPSIILFCLTLFFILFSFQIVSFVRLHSYGNEIFHEEKYSSNQDYSNRNGTKPNHKAIPITYTIMSVLSMIITIVLTVIMYTIPLKTDSHDLNDINTYRNIKSHTDNDDINDDYYCFEADDGSCCNQVFCNTQVTITVIAMITTYVTISFLPFVLLAFLYDPLQAILIYALVGIAAACIYFACLAICAACTGESPIPLCPLVLFANASFVYYLCYTLFNSYTGNL